MRSLGILLFSILWVVWVSGATATEDQLEKAFQIVRDGEIFSIDKQLFPEPHRAAVFFLSKYFTINEGDYELKRSKILRSAISLEQSTYDWLPCFQSGNEEWVGELAAIAAAETDSNIRDIAVMALMDHCQISVLDKYADTITTLAKTWTGKNTILLYGLLSSTTGEDVDRLIHSAAIPSSKKEELLQLQPTLPDVIEAKKGNRGAEKRVIATFQKELEQGRFDDWSYEATKYINSVGIKRFMASQLYSTQLVDVGLGQKRPVGFEFLCLLETLSCGDPTFPASWQEEIMPEAQRQRVADWCAKKFGIKYPKGKNRQ